MKVNYVLLAAGPVTLPRIDHVLHMGHHVVEREAEKIAAVLAKAGYYDFALYDVSGEDHKMIATFRVNIPEPVVTRNDPKNRW